MFDLTDKVSLITGGTGVLGMVFARTLVEYGSHVILADLNEQRCEEAAQEIAKGSDRKIIGCSANVAEPNDVGRITSLANDVFGRIDILINNAAAQPSGFCDSLEQYSLETWNQVIAVNLTGTFLMARAAASLMTKKGGGSIINIASIYGVVSPNQQIYEGSSINTPAVYSASKSGLIGLTRHLATYWASAGIRVNSITPGGIFRGHADPFLGNYCQRVPMRRMGHQDELRGAVIYLASDASSYVTGHNLVVDGGWTIW